MGRLNKLKPRSTRWIREDVIPRGSLTLLAGPEGSGKTTFMLNLLIDLFRTDMKIGNVHLCLAEDDVQESTIPRLYAAGADRRDMARIDHDEGTPWSFPTDIDEFFNHMLDNKIRLAVLDPIDHLIDGISTYRSRESLDPLHEVAKELDMGIVMIGHINTGGNFKTWTAGVGGARRLFGVCRSAFVWGPEPKQGEERPPIEVEPDGRCFVLTQAKNTNGPKYNGIEMPSALFERRFGPHPLKGHRAIPFYDRIADVDYTPLDIINQPGDARVIKSAASLGSKREQAKELILTLLFYADEDRGLSAQDLQEAATRLFALATFQDARKELVDEEKVEKWKEGKGEWRYRLPALEVPDTLPEDDEKGS
jgi:DNA polymerase III delta prime subunit